MQKNNQRKFLCLAAALCIALCLCACAMFSQTAQGEDGFSGDTYFSADARLITGVDGLMNGSKADTENGRYNVIDRGDGSCNIIYTDYATRTRLYLCSCPECTHSDASCPSWLSPEDCIGGVGPITDGEKLYILRAGHSQDSENAAPTQMLRMELNGENRELLFRLEDSASITGAIAKDRDNLYFIQDSVQSTDEGVRVIQQLTAWNTVTKEPVLLAEFDTTTYLIGVCPAGFILKTLENQPDDSLLQSVYLYCPLSDTMELLKQWNQNTVLAQVYHHILYCLNTETAELTAVHPGTKKETTVAKRLPFHANDQVMKLGIYDGRFCFRVNENGSFADDKTHYYAVELQGGGVTESTLRYNAFNIWSHVPIAAENSTYFLVCYNKEAVPIQSTSPAGEPFTFEGEKSFYGLILKSDYWANTPNYIPIQDNEDIPLY